MAVEPVVRPHTIELKKSPGTRYDEGVASEAITPGMIIERTPGTGTPMDDEVQKHSVQGGRGELMIAREDALQGLTINDAYSAGDIVGYDLAIPGDEYFVFVEANANVSNGDKLCSNGSGAFEIAATGDEVLAEALEDYSTGASGGHVRARITSQGQVP